VIFAGLLNRVMLSELAFPGLLVGGANLEHDCHTSRSIGYYLEALASLAPFAKHATEITLRGVTNDDRDPSVCVWLTTLPTQINV